LKRAARASLAFLTPIAPITGARIETPTWG